MVSVPNPDDYSGFWILGIPLGPCWLLYHCIFRQLDLQIHKAYSDSGVECRGITTHRHQTIHRTNFIETRRTYKIRYAYQPPGEDDIYHMDFVEVTKKQFSLGVFPVLVLPGRPNSGIPKSNVISESQRCNKAFITAMNVLSVFWTAFLVYLFAATDCPQVNGRNCHSCSTCEIGYKEIGVSAVIAFVIGLLGSALHYCGNKSRVTGRVSFKRVAFNAPSLPTENGPIPMANAVALMDGGTDEEREAHICQPTASVGPTAQAEPIAVGSETNQEPTLQAKMIELV